MVTEEELTMIRLLGWTLYPGTCGKNSYYFKVSDSQYHTEFLSWFKNWKDLEVRFWDAPQYFATKEDAIQSRVAGRGVWRNARRKQNARRKHRASA
jgi:hypothetical protein